MIPVAITLSRFGSFTGKHRFEFPAGPGLYFMQGRNDAEPRLGANGSGKSTVWDALTWVLFGKDPRGLKAGDVANWEQPKGASVEFEFESRGKLWSIIRAHSPNSWRCRLPEDEMGEHGLGCLADMDETLLRSFLPLDFTSFLNCVLMAQDQPMFLDMKAEPKAALFSEVMGLDRWIGYAARASEKAKAEDVVMRGLEQEIAKLNGQLSRQRPEDFAGSVEWWERQRKAKLVDIEYEYSNLWQKSGDTFALIEPEKVEVNRLATSLALLEEAAVKAGQEADVKKSAWIEAQTQVRLADMEEKRLDALVELLLRAESCPTCGSTGRSLDEALKRVTGDLGRARLKAKKLAEDRSGAEQQWNQAEDVAIGATRTVQEAREALTLAQRAAEEANRSHEATERELDRLDAEVDRIEAEVNPYHALQDQARHEGERLREAHDEVLARLAHAAERHSMLGFWIRGFKDLRLQLIAESLEQLAIEVNGCVLALGLVGWELVFEVDRETKSGSISRGFSVFVRSPHNDRQVPWESWSGGEAQRLRLAAQQGLANLIRSATGAVAGFEVWDEPTRGMSASGIEDLLESLSERARRERRQVWIVDHRSPGYGGFDGGVTVVKDEKGSRFEVPA